MSKNFKSYKEMDSFEKSQFVGAIMLMVLLVGVMTIFTIQNPQPFPQYNWSILGRCLSF